MNNTNLKSFITWLAEAGKQAFLAFEDGKITIGEIAGFIPVGLQVTELIPKAHPAWLEIVNGTTADHVDTLNHLESSLPYLKPETVAKIKNGAAVVLFGAGLIGSFKAA